MVIIKSAHSPLPFDTLVTGMGQTAENENEHDISSTTLLASEGKIGKNEDNISSTIHLIVHLCC